MKARASVAGGEAALVVRRHMGATERMMYYAEQSFGGAFRIAAVLTLCSSTPLSAPSLSAAIAAVAARHDALRTVVVREDAFAVAPQGAVPVVGVKVAAGDMGKENGVTAAAFADAHAVLAAGTGGAGAAPHGKAAAATATPTPAHLPWHAGVYLPAPGREHDPADAAAVVYYLPHYLADGTSIDILAAATVDALAAAVGPAAKANTATVPLAPPLGEVYPPPGGAGIAGMARGVAAFLAAETAAPLTRRHRRALAPPPAGPPATAATRTASAVDAVIEPAAVGRFAAAARAAGTTVGAGLVAAFAAALDGAGVVARGGGVDHCRGRANQWAGGGARGGGAVPGHGRLLHWRRRRRRAAAGGRRRRPGPVGARVCRPRDRARARLPRVRGVRLWRVYRGPGVRPWARHAPRRRPLAGAAGPHHPAGGVQRGTLWADRRGQRSGGGVRGRTADGGRHPADGLGGGAGRAARALRVHRWRPHGAGADEYGAARVDGHRGGGAGGRGQDDRGGGVTGEDRGKGGAGGAAANGGAAAKVGRRLGCQRPGRGGGAALAGAVGVVEPPDGVGAHGLVPDERAVASVRGGEKAPTSPRRRRDRRGGGGGPVWSS